MWTHGSAALGNLGNSYIGLVDENRKTCLPDLITYSTVINGLCRDGCLEEAKKTFIEMLGRNLYPDSTVYDSNHFHTQCRRNEPLRVYSMVKYASIARGDAEIFMKFARAGYKKKIWDHATGAGGVVTDAGGHPLCFSKGVYLQGLNRGIIACSGAALHHKIITGVDASWNSSSL